MSVEVVSPGVVIEGKEAGLRNLHGRGMNKISQVYKLPADKKEMDRLSLQHRMWRLMVGGLYPPKISDTVEKLLAAPVSGARPPAILDIGSGSGIWAVEMATEFPHTQVIGLDLSKSSPTYKPTNCSFVVGDATRGLPEHAGLYDIIHARSVAGHVKDPVGFVKILGKCLRPGGMFIFADGNIWVVNENGERFLPAQADQDIPNSSWFSRMMFEKKICEGHQETISAGDQLLPWLRNDDQFEDAEAQVYLSPVNWPGEGIEHGEEIGQIMARNLLEFTESSKPMFLAHGVSKEEFALWSTNIQDEIINLKVKMYARWHVAWALKKSA